MNNTSVLFICGSLEPGKNGVGDYTRSLVGSLETLGVKGNIIATHDTDVTEIIEEEQCSEGVSVPVLRIPRDTTKEARTASIVSALRQIGPDWVSVQFVPYSFHRKGLPLVFLRQLEVLLSLSCPPNVSRVLDWHFKELFFVPLAGWVVAKMDSN